MPNSDRFARYLRADELHTAFNFSFLEAGWDAARTRRVIDQTLDELGTVGAPATWVLSNHDVQRHPTRFGGGEIGLRRARAATLLMLALPGGAYIYQGEELGLEEVLDIPAEWRQDPIFARTGGERVGRDGCRVPLPWSGTEAPFGFGPSGIPWLPQPSAWAALTAEAQDRVPDSTLAFYQAALRARRASPALGDGPMHWLDSPDGILAFRRGGRLTCVVNFTDQPIELPDLLKDAVVLATSSPSGPGTLAPATAAWYAQ